MMRSERRKFFCFLQNPLKPFCPISSPGCKDAEKAEKCTDLDGTGINNEDVCTNFGCCFDNGHCWRKNGGKSSIYL